ASSEMNSGECKACRESDLPKPSLSYAMTGREIAWASSPGNVRQRSTLPSESCSSTRGGVPALCWGVQRLAWICPPGTVMPMVSVWVRVLSMVYDECDGVIMILPGQVNGLT